MSEPATFDRFAAEYDALLDRSVAIAGEDGAYFADYKASYLARILGPDFAGCVLDYGCGTGSLALAMRRRLPAAIVHGFDVSGKSIEHARGRLGAAGSFTANADELGSQYDAIVMANVLHHVAPARRRAVVEDLAARLAPGGRLVVFEHNPANPLTRYAVSRCPFDRDAVLLSPRETRRLLTQAHVEPVRCQYIVFFPRFVSWLRPLEPRLGRVPFGAQYACVAARVSGSPGAPGKS